MFDGHVRADARIAGEQRGRHRVDQRRLSTRREVDHLRRQQRALRSDAERRREEVHERVHGAHAGREISHLHGAFIQQRPWSLLIRGDVVGIPRRRETEGDLFSLAVDRGIRSLRRLVGLQAGASRRVESNGSTPVCPRNDCHEALLLGWAVFRL
jgi:hypothetical protein